MPVTLVGRTHKLVGKRLWEIIGSLKDFGVGRMVVRSKDERYPEISYLRILSARPKMDTGPQYTNQDNMKGHVLVEKVFRGQKFGTVDISTVAYKPDYKLIPKHEEYKYLQAFEACAPPKIKILPASIEMPPLLKMLAERENHSSKVLTLRLNKGNGINYRQAEDGETPTVQISLGLGTPVSPQLYEGVL